MEIKSLCILGLGYIGLPTASTFANHGIKVIGVDINPSIIESLKNGKVHIFEPGLQEITQAVTRSGNLIVKNKVQKADAFLIAVPTPFKEGKLADLSYVCSAAEAIVPCLQKGNLVILESTSPPRTTIDIVGPILEKSGLMAGDDFYLAYSPERVLPGQILRELIENDRVIGGIDNASADAGKSLYSKFVKGEIFLTDATTAEMVKLMENTYRDINIAAANEFARLAVRFKVNVWEAINLANRHPRVDILNPGPGVGGHCISVDPWFLVEAAPDLATLIHTARTINDDQPRFVLDFLKQKTGNLNGKRIAALGLAYKPDVDDLRESPAVEVVKLLIEAGASVNVYEPFDTEFTIDSTETKTDLENTVSDANIILLLVNHSQFKDMSPEKMREISKANIVLDFVGGWERNAWESEGYDFYCIGDGKN